MADSDAQLVARLVAADDRAAFETLVRRHQSPVRHFFRRLTRNDSQRADDLAQETFLKVFRSISSLLGEAKFSTWLYRVAYNTFLNDQRNRLASAPIEEEALAVVDFAGRAGDEADFDRLLQRSSDWHIVPKAGEKADEATDKGQAGHTADEESRIG